MIFDPKTEREPAEKWRRPKSDATQNCHKFMLHHVGKFNEHSQARLKRVLSWNRVEKNIFTMDVTPRHAHDHDESIGRSVERFFFVRVSSQCALEIFPIIHWKTFSHSKIFHGFRNSSWPFLDDSVIYGNGSCKRDWLKLRQQSVDFTFFSPLLYTFSTINLKPSHKCTSIVVGSCITESGEKWKKSKLWKIFFQLSFMRFSCLPSSSSSCKI